MELLLHIIFYTILALLVVCVAGIVVSSWRISYRTPDPIDTGEVDESEDQDASIDNR